MTVVLVVGPPLSGATAVAAALRQRLSGCHVTETASGAPDVVVFVVSAAAPLAHCDAALLDGAAAETDAVVAVVSKIDVHRTWRSVMETNQDVLARHSSRYQATPWVGVAADPQIGAPATDALVDAIHAVLAADGRIERNRSRAASVRAERAAQRQAQAVRRSALQALLRAEVRHTRLELGAQARSCAVSLRADLQQRVAVSSRRDIAALDEQVRSRVSQTADDFDAQVRRRLAELCRGQGVPVPEVIPTALWDGLPPAHRPAGDNVAVVFAVTFGLGLAMTLGRVLSEFGGAPRWAFACCGAAGLALAVWVARTRRLAAARLASDRWVAEVCADLRHALEDRVLAAEAALLAAIAAERRSPN